MYKALVHTVPGSGTRFICEFLDKCLGYKRIEKSKPKFEEHLSDCIYIQTHVWDDRIAAAEHESVRVVIPIRPPYLTYITRRYRNADFEGDSRINMVNHWEQLIQRAASIDPIYVPIEEDVDRRQLLHSIANFLEAPVVNQAEFDRFADTWPKIGTAGSMSERKKYERSGLIDGVTPIFLDFAVDWYKGVVLELEGV